MHQRAREFAARASDEYGLDIDVREFPEGTKTAAAAAAAIDCEVGQIASSLVFDVDGESVVVLTSGANRVSESKLAAHFGVDEGDVSMADPETVRETTGWAIGGVPPFCHARAVPVLFDESLAEYETVWAAAGTPRSVFPIAPEEVRRASDAEPADVTRPR